MSTNNTLVLQFEAEVFFGDETEAAAGRRALEAAGFDLEPRPGLVEDNFESVWMMARAARPCDGDIEELVLALRELLEQHGGAVWEIGPIGPAPHYYEMMKSNLHPHQYLPLPPRDRGR